MGNAPNPSTIGMHRLMLWVVLFNLALLVFNSWLSMTNVKRLNERIQAIEHREKLHQMGADQ